MTQKINVFVFVIFLTSSTYLMADKTILAGGCFWCMESDFEKLDGVTDVISGFTGGTLKNPTYKGNHEGHYETVEITYDPNIINYKELLDYYLATHVWLARHRGVSPASGQLLHEG